MTNTIDLSVPQQVRDLYNLGDYWRLLGTARLGHLLGRSQDLRRRVTDPTTQAYAGVAIDGICREFRRRRDEWTAVAA